MKKTNKLALFMGLAVAAIAASSCTANFCTDVEKGKIAYAIEPGVSVYYSAEDYANLDSSKLAYSASLGSNLYQVVVKNEDGTYARSAQLNEVIKTAKSQSIIEPSLTYFVNFDKEVLFKAAELGSLDLSSASLTIESVNAALKEYGKAKYVSESGTMWERYREINNKLRSELGYTVAASVDFENVYIASMTQVIEQYRSCITVFDEIEYGNYGEDKLTIKLDKITWKSAWKKGLIEGLVLYPVAWLVDTFARIFAGGKTATPAMIAEKYATGVPQLLSLILVTLIVRIFIFLVTIKSTLSQKKMTDLQPELAKIQAKYPNSNTNQSEKQRLAEEQMKLYKKHKVNPLSQLLVLIIQFPVFIGVWGAMTGSAALSTGTALNLDLSQSIWAALKMGPKHHAGWWTAFVLIILMSVSQFLSMKIPQWIQKAKTKKVARLAKNPAQNQQNKTANMVSYVMLVMIIVMGFTLPASMGVYWFIGAIVSMLQTLLTTFVFTGKKHKK